MSRRHLRNENGQSLIQLAALMALLIGFAALAIDVGNGYLSSRRMQNAADAAVLAGARELCKGNTSAVAIAKARDYLLRNGVQAAQINAADITVTSGVIRVRANHTEATWLARVFGDDSLDVSANAAATCGRATSACGLWPIAFELALYEQVPCGKRMVIWNAEKEDLNDSCVINGQTRPICDCYKCDKNGDGEDDFQVLTGVSRGWLDFTTSTDPLYSDPCDSNGCGTSELKCRLIDDSGALLKLPACVASLSGVKAGAKSAVDSRSGQIVNIPLFTSTGCPVGNHCGDESYYVTRFGCVLVDGWNHQFELEPKPGMPKSYKKIKSKAVTVYKSCGDSCVTFCGTTDGIPPEPWELSAVGLVE